MMEQILTGILPTEVFKKSMALDKSLTKPDIAKQFKVQFPSVNSLAISMIWHWSGPANSSGISDESLNQRLLALLANAGYLPQEACTDTVTHSAV
jgi:hypothetical protein